MVTIVLCDDEVESLQRTEAEIERIKEKLIGAYNQGFKTVYIPEQNKREIEYLPDYIKDGIEIICVNNYEVIFDDLFTNKK